MKTVYLFTNTFPYGINSETFIEEEMRVAGNLGLHIVVLPLHRKRFVGVYLQMSKFVIHWLIRVL